MREEKKFRVHEIWQMLIITGIGFLGFYYNLPVLKFLFWVGIIFEAIVLGVAWLAVILSPTSVKIDIALTSKVKNGKIRTCNPIINFIFKIGYILALTFVWKEHALSLWIVSTLFFEEYRTKLLEDAMYTLTNFSK